MKKAYVFRIYPNKKQWTKLNRTLSTCRHLYNDALSERKRQAELNRLYAEFQIFPWGYPDWITYEDQANDLAPSKTPEQKETYSQVLQDALRRLDKNFKNFFRGAGYPRFKSSNRYNSFTYPQSGFELKGDELRLSKIGKIKIIQHRAIPGKIKTCTIKKDIDQWYAIFTVEIESQKPVNPVSTQNKVGVDVGLSSLITLSSGIQIEPPEHFRNSEKKLSKEQVRLSRKKKNSLNRQKQKTKVAVVHRRIRNQRADFAHKTGRWLVNNHDLIVFENLNIKGMVQNHHLAKSINDAGWCQLIRITSYKAEEAGKMVELVNPVGTSQNCSHCGNVVPKDLNVRTHVCPFCGLVLDRDHNAAINILKRCTAGTAGIEACKSGLDGDMMKQEDAQTFRSE